MTLLLGIHVEMYLLIYVRWSLCSEITGTSSHSVQLNVVTENAANIHINHLYYIIYFILKTPVLQCFRCMQGSNGCKLSSSWSLN